MPISKRTLTKWRKEALRMDADLVAPARIRELCDRILLLTQELLDQQLLREK